jgi:hypothetical protein
MLPEERWKIKHFWKQEAKAALSCERNLGKVFIIRGSQVQWKNIRGTQLPAFVLFSLYCIKTEI